ncbi:hypothetical protein Cwoe_0611 [Conexibacter woesei DSM 14684]|uniref:Uncharacterized protein n=1 Tax=Conexibacter woesei (strain DSM 14684 / CCUG 47730 / CIP 108061 / JCM 11494 / NBRC 100937 / ID131577) TaxID=469383 RepID=D3F979_CONWI|nr:hypothetical protein Cwoe_0611 [Conexibacter woesei DSM 14684]
MLAVYTLYVAPPPPWQHGLSVALGLRRRSGRAVRS